MKIHELQTNLHFSLNSISLFFKTLKIYSLDKIQLNTFEQTKYMSNSLVTSYTTDLTFKF